MQDLKVVNDEWVADDEVFYRQCLKQNPFSLYCYCSIKCIIALFIMSACVDYQLWEILQEIVRQSE